MHKLVLIAGYYGFGNTGDEAILTAMLSSLRSAQPDLKFVVVSGNPEQTSARYDVESALWTDLQSILDAVRRSDVVILGGGGLFQDYWDTVADTMLTPGQVGIPFYCSFVFLAGLYGKPCMLYSVGVGPLFT